MDGFIELTHEKIASREGLNELNRMLRVLFENIPGDGDTVRIFKGYGTPEGVVSASPGSIYMRLDPVSTTTGIYIKTSGTDASTWTAK